MRILKKILIGIVAFIALILIVALFVNKNMATNKTVVINKPKEEVFNYIKQLKNQDNYSVWGKMDPNMKKEYRGTDATEGFVAAWEGNKDVGKGEQQIVKISEGERIDFDLHFIEPMESNAKVYMATETVSPTQTKVTWAFDSKMAYPFNIMGLFVNMGEMVGKDFQTGLDNLKAILEK